MTYFIGEADLQTLNFNLLPHKRAGDWSKDPWLFIWRLLVPAVVQSKKCYFKLLCFCIQTIIRKSKQPGKWKLPRDLRTVRIWPGWLFSVLKTQTQSSSVLGEEVKGEEKKKQNKTESSTLVSPPWQPVAFHRWHMQFAFILLSLAQPTRVVFLSFSATESTLKETAQELLLLWETPRTQFNLIISWNKSSHINFYDPMHF